MMNETGGKNRDDRDDVARLVRLAGKRTTVSSARTERVKAAAREQWVGEVQRLSHRRKLWVVAGLAVAAVLILAVLSGLLPLGPGAPVDATAGILIEALAGEVWRRGPSTAAGNQAQTVGRGDVLEAGSVLESGSDGRVLISLPTGHSVRLHDSTRLVLLEDGFLELDQGTIYVDSGSGAEKGTSLVVRTSFGIIEEMGTQFEVRLMNDLVQVRTREGLVIMHHEGTTHEVWVGDELSVTLDGSISRRAITTFGDEWSWLAGITPVLELEGKSARTFLEWIARERGLQLAFADESVAHTAGETILGGSGQQLSIDNALDAVLPTCRMSYQIREGILIISAAP